jgi:hypothetical protein
VMKTDAAVDTGYTEYPPFIPYVFWFWDHVLSVLSLCHKPVILILVMLINRIVNPRLRVHSEDGAVIESHAYSCLCMLKRNRVCAREKSRYLPRADAYVGGLLEYLSRELNNKYQGTRLHSWKYSSEKKSRMWVSATLVMKHEESSGRQQQSRLPISLSTISRCGSRYVRSALYL